MKLPTVHVLCQTIRGADAKPACNRFAFNDIDGPWHIPIDIPHAMEIQKRVNTYPDLVKALHTARVYVRANMHALGELAGAMDVNTLDQIEQALRVAGESI